MKTLTEREQQLLDTRRKLDLRLSAIKSEKSKAERRARTHALILIGAAVSTRTDVIKFAQHHYLSVASKAATEKLREKAAREAEAVAFLLPKCGAAEAQLESQGQS